jgi:Ca-activated chloride channel family protein
MQRVGGTEEKRARDPAQGDPSLAIPLQKLEQVRAQDSPAQLYQMIENHEPRPASTDKGKDW